VYVKRDMHGSVAYWTWTWAFHRHTGLCVVLQSILSLPLSLRKDLLGLCRSQSLPLPHSSVRAGFSHLSTLCLIPSFPSRSLDKTSYIQMSLESLIFLYSDLFLDHLTCSIISHGLRIAPITDPDDFHTSQAQAISKELSAAITRFPHTTLDFRPILSSSAQHRSLPFSTRLPPSEEVASDTYIQFVGLRSRFSNAILYPRGGSKTVGTAVSSQFWDSYYRHGLCFKHDGSSNSVVDQVTTDDCLRMYQETRGYPSGPVEVRSSWKYSQISPRVYYARGGDVQVAAQYMQEIVNILIDEFPEVHRLNRFSPPREQLLDIDVEVIYDYSSFTSLLDAVIPFVDSLSQFFQGTLVHVVDPVMGLVPMDLGDMFAEYNRVCNHYGDFDISRLSVLEMSQNPIFQHTCGMLGVEGNIFLATLLHGLHLRFIAGLHRSRCVGDDARFHFPTSDGMLSLSDKEYLLWLLESIGEINSDKLRCFERFADPERQSYRYLKRPIHRDTNVMIEGILLPLPSQIPLLGKLDPYHTFFQSDSHPCRVVFKQIVRFVDLLQTHSITISSDRDDTTYSIVIHLAYLRRLMLNKDPEGEFSTIGRSSLRSMYRIPSISDLGYVRYIDWFCGEIDYYESVRFPKFGGAEEEGTCDGRIGSSMVRVQSKCRSFLERMGYLKSEMLFDSYSMADIGLDQFKMLLEGDYQPVMRYNVINSIPVWWSQLPKSL